MILFYKIFLKKLYYKISHYSKIKRLYLNKKVLLWIKRLVQRQRKLCKLLFTLTLYYLKFTLKGKWCEQWNLLLQVKKQVQDC
jgi:hypothetical protein